MLIKFFAPREGAGATGGTGGTPPPAAPPAPAGQDPAGTPPADPQGTPPAGGTTPPAQPATGDGTTLTPEALQAELKKVRDEAAARRVAERAAQQKADEVQARLDAITKALGGEPENQDPAKLTEQVQNLQSQLAAERMQNAAQAAAAAAGANAAVLVPYLKGTGALDNLTTGDPAALRSELDALVKATLEAQPAFKVQHQPPASGPADAPGGATPPRKFSRAEIARMTPAQVEANQEAIDAWLAAGAPE